LIKVKKSQGYKGKMWFNSTTKRLGHQCQPAYGEEQSKYLSGMITISKNLKMIHEKNYD
jgi:hypothetical protein